MSANATSLGKVMTGAGMKNLVHYEVLKPDKRECFQFYRRNMSPQQRGHVTNNENQPQSTSKQEDVLKSWGLIGLLSNAYGHLKELKTSPSIESCGRTIRVYVRVKTITQW